MSAVILMLVIGAAWLMSHGGPLYSCLTSCQAKAQEWTFAPYPKAT